MHENTKGKSEDTEKTKVVLNTEKTKALGDDRRRRKTMMGSEAVTSPPEAVSDRQFQSGRISVGIY